jgi:hypothetical protein
MEGKSQGELSLGSEPLRGRETRGARRPVEAPAGGACRTAGSVALGRGANREKQGGGGTVGRHVGEGGAGGGEGRPGKVGGGAAVEEQRSRGDARGGRRKKKEPRTDLRNQRITGTAL